MVILKMKMKIGPKGQVVIPKEMRDEKKIFPGDEVLIELSNEGILIEKPTKDVIADFERIAKSGKSINKVDSDKDYAEMMKQRWNKLNLK